MQPGDGPDAANKTHRPGARRSHLMPQRICPAESRTTAGDTILTAGGTLTAANLGSAELHPGYEDGAKRGQRGHDPSALAPRPSPLAPRPFFLRVAWMQPGDGPDGAAAASRHRLNTTR
jgi:hypothetical protein